MPPSGPGWHNRSLRQLACSDQASSRRPARPTRSGLRRGFAQTMRQARQLASHGHFTVNGRRVNVPSYQVREGSTIAATSSAKNFLPIQEAMEVTPEPPVYLERDKAAVSGRLIRMPE